jgi:nucleoside phosphorylase
MLGHCAGLHSSQQLGDHVLAHQRMREDHWINQVRYIVKNYESTGKSNLRRSIAALRLTKITSPRKGTV